MSDIDTTGCGTAETRRDRGPYQQVYSGLPFYLLDPKPEDVTLEDIAHSLAHQCRYMGHCSPFLSVAQHSVMVSEIIKPGLARFGLLHDAAEAYMSDITRPLKIALEDRAPGVLQGIVGPIELAIAKAFDLSWKDWRAAHAEIKAADNKALATERVWFMKKDPRCDWGKLPDPLSEIIIALGPSAAKNLFLDRARLLGLKTVTP